MKLKFPFFIFICFCVSSYSLYAQQKEQPLSALYYYWDGPYSKWEDPYTILYSYDSVGHNTQEIWLKPGTADSSRKLSGAYDRFGNEIKTSEYWYVQDSGWRWSSETKHTYIYNAIGKVDTLTEEYKGTRGYYSAYRYVYHYNADSSVAEELVYEWDTSRFVPEIYVTMSRQADTTLSIERKWKDSSWIITGRSIYYISGKNRINIDQEWIDSAWTNAFRRDYLYYDNGDYGGYDSYWWDPNNLDWFHTYTYHIYYRYDGDKLREKEEYSYAFHDRYHNGSKLVCTYASDPIPEAPQPPDTLTLRLYPNPVHDVLHVDNVRSYKQASVMNMNGRMVLSQPINGNELKLDLHGLRNGLYLLKLEGDEGTVVKKFIKR